MSNPPSKNFPQNDIANLLERHPSAKSLGTYHEVQFDAESNSYMKWPLLLEIQSCEKITVRINAHGAG